VPQADREDPTVNVHRKPPALVRLIASATIVAAIASGCRFIPGAGVAPTPYRCLDRYSPARCDAILSAAAEQLRVADDDVTGLEIEPDPTPRPDGVLEIRSGGGLAVRLHVGADERTVQICPGVSRGPACTDEPFTWTIDSPIGTGYSDVPCAGEPPDGCATLPSLDPDAIEDAVPLRIPSRVIPVPSVGRYEVKLGEASLPNGVLTQAQATLANPNLPGIRLSSDGLVLAVRSLVSGRPSMVNKYEHGWWPGVEPVAVLLIFEARHADPGATIEVRNVLVR
jgi:hypothetical protein